MLDQRWFKARPKRAMTREARPLGRAVLSRDGAARKRCLTFEVRGRQQRDARPGLWRMYCATARAWWRAVVGPFDRRVRPQTAPVACRFGGGWHRVAIASSSALPRRAALAACRHSAKRRCLQGVRCG